MIRGLQAAGTPAGAPSSRLHRSAAGPRARPASRSRTPLRLVAMRVVIQRVTSASVEVDGQLVSKIGPGLLCLVGITNTDTQREAELMKLLKCRAFHNPETGRPWELDVSGINGEILLVSQFTLYGRLRKPKPDYSRAMGPGQAKQFYAAFVERVRDAYVPERVKDGVFGAMMSVKLENDGPVTYVLDSEDFGNGPGSVSGVESSIDDSSSER